MGPDVEQALRELDERTKGALAATNTAVWELDRRTPSGDVVGQPRRTHQTLHGAFDECVEVGRPRHLTAFEIEFPHSGVRCGQRTFRALVQFTKGLFDIWSHNAPSLAGRGYQHSRRLSCNGLKTVCNAARLKHDYSEEAG